MAKIELREYQSKALTMLYDWMSKNEGHPCVSLPTGSGKSIVIAELCRHALTEWPETRVLMLTRSIELVTQNAEKLRAIWPGAPMGIYSASAGKRQLGEPITIGGPLSIVNVIEQIGSVDICIVDEAHDISHKDEGSYRKIINYLLQANPATRIVGFTASPFRTGHGLITDKPAIFDAIIEPVSIEELVYKKYLSKLRSKVTSFTLDTSGVKKRGGDYVESDLQKAVDTEENNTRMIEEVIQRGAGRKSWMFFCSGVDHARHLADLLNNRGVTAVAVTGDMPKQEREEAVSAFRSGRIQAVTQVNCLSTGFDHPSIDLLVMARPTMSPGLYLQQAGRGLRIAPGKADCLVLDFAGVVSTHGPITAVQPPKKSGSGNGEAPVKVCETCHELCPISARRCPACGTPFPEPEKKPLLLHSDDIMGIEGTEMSVRSWIWRKHTSKASGKQMLAVTYYGALSDAPVTEYIAVMHEGYAGQKAIQTLLTMARRSRADLQSADDLEEAVKAMNSAKAPTVVEYRKEGKFFRVINREWRDDDRA